MASRMLAAAGVLAIAWGGVGGAIAPEAGAELPVAKEMAVSFLESFVSEPGKPFVANCVAEAGDVSEDLQNALGDLKEALQSKRLDEVSKALRSIADMLDEAPTALTQCKEGAANAREMATALVELLHEGPMKTMWQHAVADHVRITSELDAGLAAYAAKNYSASGGQLGKALRHVVVGKQNVTASGTSAVNLEAAFAFVNGFVAWDDGSLSGHCVLHVVHQGLRVQHWAEGLLNAVNDEDVYEISYSLSAIADLLDDLTPGMQEHCGEYARNVLETAAALKKLPAERHIAKVLQEHLLADHKNITGELDSALARSGAKDSVGLGKYSGKLLRLLLIGEPTAARAPVVV